MLLEEVHMAKINRKSLNPDSLLADQIAKRFNLSELNNDICFRCNIDFEELPGFSKPDKIREVIHYFKRRDLMDFLISVLKLCRPKTRWQYVIEIKNPNFGIVAPQKLFGKWQGGWEWYGQKRDADLLIDHDKSVLRIKYKKYDVLTIVEQQIKIIEVDDWIFLIGTDYEFIEQGEAVGYHLDSFQLRLSNRRTALSGIKTDSREIPSEVWFKKKRIR